MDSSNLKNYKKSTNVDDILSEVAEDEVFDVSEVKLSDIKLKHLEDTEPFVEEMPEPTKNTTVKVKSPKTQEPDILPKESIFLRILKNIVPFKGDEKYEIIRKSALLCSIIVLVVAVGMIFGEFSKNSEDLEIKSELIEMRGEVKIDEADYVKIKEKVPTILDEYVSLYKRNSDIVGWINIEGTAVDYPILQTDDNNFYLDNNFDKEYSRSGSIFADHRASITPESRSANIVLYGHNMASGEFFASIMNYKAYNDRLDYYSAHPVINMDTIYEKGKYKIFAAMTTNVDEEDGEVFKYFKIHEFKTKGEFNDYVGKVLDRSMFYNPDVDVTYGDEIITLSTCDFSMGSADLRFVVFARRVRKGESDTVDVDKAYINQDPLYFDLYYDIMGGEWGGRKWDSKLLKSYNPKAP